MDCGAIAEREHRRRFGEGDIAIRAAMSIKIMNTSFASGEVGGARR